MKRAGRAVWGGGEAACARGGRPPALRWGEPSAGADGFVVELTPVKLEQMPAYARRDEVWRRVGA